MLDFLMFLDFNRTDWADRNLLDGFAVFVYSIGMQGLREQRGF